MVTDTRTPVCWYRWDYQLGDGCKVAEPLYQEPAKRPTVRPSRDLLPWWLVALIVAAAWVLVIGSAVTGWAK
jgi:hypothetical protein